ncbi:hypothetical protein M8C21_001008 [Ambrosia artemisiifolia]|uniref:Protein NRDE2 homolog n=1 Tax=Ambrosia artemisiifolia TaxID=4212 RepID=A0AAD5BWD5_AMBAR|nr:hypothetical protein M8C21_001008 [Ambrosia artemisiifolia]
MADESPSPSPSPSPSSPAAAEEEEPLNPPSTTLFPISKQPQSSPQTNALQLSNPTTPTWLINSSFTPDLSSINDVVSSLPYHYSTSPEPEPQQTSEQHQQQQLDERRRYELVESSSASDQDQDFDDRIKKKEKKKRRKRKERDYDNGSLSRKQKVQSWASNNNNNNKEYYFDSRGDLDNLAFGSLYRMDIARYKLFHATKSSMFNYNAFGSSNTKRWDFDRDNDANSLDTKLKSEGRYWSAKYAALEHHRNFKRFRIVAPKDSSQEITTDFIPLSDDTTSTDGQPTNSSVVEESWEDEVLRKTKDFNKVTREQPYNDKIWLEFAEFQDKVESRQPQRGARLQTLEKKISILEKAAELNPDNEELLLALMNAYQRRDNNDVLIGRWEKLLTHHSGSYKLWREFLRFVQGDFSRFKVSEVRKMFANAIQALSAACSKHHRQANQNDKSSADPLLVQQELGLLNIFVSLCRFEWNSGYLELATALFQAEIEYSLFCPSLLLSEHGKQRLFEYFWNSTGARIGEDGALGWLNWLEKEEEQRQKAMMKESESSPNVDEGGWTGWHEPKSEGDVAVDDIGMGDGGGDDVGVGDDGGDGDVGTEEKDDTEALMKLLGINGEIEANGDSVKDEVIDKEGDEQLLRSVLFEDVSEYLFSVTTEEVRLSLVYHFIDFFGGRISQWSSTNSSGWAERMLMMESPPDSMLDDLKKAEEILRKNDSCDSGYSLEHVLSSFDNINMRKGALVAEELSKTRMNSCSLAVTPCRPLAKSLLKSNRQDVHLCGVYAKREAAFGNIEYARKAFDMALLSIEGLPWATWIRGTIDDNSVASVSSAALFEELTTGWEAAIDVLNQALSTVLPERRSQSHQLELLFNFHMNLLWKHHSQSELANVWKFVLQGLQIYPFRPKLYNAVVQIGHLHTSPNKLRWIIDDFLHKKPSVTLCLFALSYEISKGSSHHRIHRIFEKALADNVLRDSVLLWRLYIDYEIHVTCDLSAARRIYFRAIHTCPWSKKLWLDGFTKLNSVLTAKELSDLLEVMRDKEINVRTDVYEILLQDEMDVST